MWGLVLYSFFKCHLRSRCCMGYMPSFCLYTKYLCNCTKWFDDEYNVCVHFPPNQLSCVWSLVDILGAIFHRYFHPVRCIVLSFCFVQVFLSKTHFAFPTATHPFRRGDRYVLSSLLRNFGFHTHRSQRTKSVDWAIADFILCCISIEFHHMQFGWRNIYGPRCTHRGNIFCVYICIYICISLYIYI